MNFRFLAEHFKYAVTAEDNADTANRLLDKYIETLPVVVHKKKCFGWFGEMGVPEEAVDAKARLWGVEEFEAKKCEHEHFKYQVIDREQSAICRFCGARLRAKWEVVELAKETIDDLPY